MEASKQLPTQPFFGSSSPRELRLLLRSLIQTWAVRVTEGMEKFLTGSKSLWHPHCAWINMFLIPRPLLEPVPASSPMLPSVPPGWRRGEKETLLGALM